MGEISPGKVQNLSPRAAWLYPMRLDEVWALLFPASSPPAHWPHCQFVYLRSKVCSPLLSASPRGYALRFATVTLIGSGWLLSSNKILPMLGTLGQTIGFCRLPSVEAGASVVEHTWEGRPQKTMVCPTVRRHRSGDLCHRELVYPLQRRLDLLQIPPRRV